MKLINRVSNRLETVSRDLSNADSFFENIARGIPDRGICNAGWIAGVPQDRRKLRQIGVRGRMRYTPPNDDGLGAFAMCLDSDDVIKRLLVCGWLNYPGAFTKVDMRTGVQLPRRKQIWWFWPSKNQLVFNGYVKGKRCWGPGNPSVWPWQRRMR